MSNTIYYRGKLKRTCSPRDVYEKCSGAIKKTGVTKNWICTFHENDISVVVDFNDGESENLVFKFVEGKVHGFCKLFFSMDNDMYDKKSPSFACMKMLYSLKKLCSEYEITDDYSIWEGFLETMKYRARFRNLTEDEEARVRKYFDMGYTNHEDMLLAFISEDLQIPQGEKLTDHIMENAVYPVDEHWILPVLETWLYETCTYGKEGRVSGLSRERYTDLNMFTLSHGGFVLVVEECFAECFAAYGFVKEDDTNAFGVKHALLRKMFREKYAPAFKIADPFERCILAYRLFLSALDFTDFKFVGKNT